MPRPLCLLAFALAGCLDLQPPTPSIPPQLTALRATVGSLDAVPRVPEFQVSFDRAMAPPEPSSVMLFREPLSSALVTDARDGVVTAMVSAIATATSTALPRASITARPICAPLASSVAP